jgi:sporulation protein YqfC
MKSLQQGLKPWLIKYLALPSDVVLGLPRITIVGDLHVYIENHQGLITYSDTELKLKSNKGYIQITGTSFVLKMMLPEEILLEGMIKEVTFIPD